jgi:Fic family protein
MLVKKPMPPPTFESLLAAASKRRFTEVFSKVSGPLVGGRYLHWDDLRHRTPPEGLTHEEWWLGLKFQRMTSAKDVPLLDTGGKRFGYSQPDPISESLHEIDMGAGGHIQMPPEITNQETRDRYYVSSLIEEAITSSQLEGAATTRAVAKEMLRTNRAPRDRSERMILNNFLTMKRIGEVKTEALSPDLVFEIHRIITEETLDDPSAAGRFRRADEDIRVWTPDDILLHRPPAADELGARMKAMCDFANGKTPETFVHPVVRAIILHFWLAYDHPFCDGNGRAARALFYWCMLRNGFWLFEFITISSILHRAPSQYARSFLHTESDGNDLTYFVVYQLEVIRRAIRELHEYVDRKARQLQTLEAELRGAAILNCRQKTLISHALRHPRYRYTIESHRTSHRVVYQTARADLLDLRDRGLLVASKLGRAWVFTPVEDLHARLVKLG